MAGHSRRQELSNRASAMKRHHGPDSIQYLDALRDRAAALLEESIRQFSEQLRDEDRARLVALLGGVAA